MRWFRGAGRGFARWPRRSGRIAREDEERVARRRRRRYRLTHRDRWERPAPRSPERLEGAVVEVDGPRPLGPAADVCALRGARSPTAGVLRPAGEARLDVLEGDEYLGDLRSGERVLPEQPRCLVDVDNDVHVVAVGRDSPGDEELVDGARRERARQLATERVDGGGDDGLRPAVDKARNR